MILGAHQRIREARGVIGMSGGDQRQTRQSIVINIGGVPIGGGKACGGARKVRIAREQRRAGGNSVQSG
jgi:hypothetical protein